MANQTISVNADFSQLGQSLDGAAKMLSDFASGPVSDAGKSIETAVTKSFDAVANTIARAAVSGKLSMDKLVDAILADFERIALKQFVIQPVEDLVSSFASSLFSGARAAGGPVDAGSAYLVGEQGPELFVPNTSGTIAPNSALSSSRP